MVERIIIILKCTSEEEMKYRSTDGGIDKGGRTLCKRPSFSFITIHIRGGDERGKERKKKKKRKKK